MTLASNICIFLLATAVLGAYCQIPTSPTPPDPEPYLDCRNLDYNSNLCCNFFQYIYNSTFNHSAKLNTTHDFTTDESTLLLYSGHSLNDLGFYGTCVKNDTFYNYFMLEFTDTQMNVPDGSMGFYIGLCVPQYCSIDYLQSESKLITRTMEFLNIPYVKDLGVVFVDPHAYTIHNDFYLAVAIIVLVVFVILNIMGTYLPQYAKTEQSQDPFRSIPNNTGLNESYGASLQGEDSLLSNGAPRRPSSKQRFGAWLRARPKFLKMLECFDFYKNMRGFFKQEKAAGMDNSLNVLDGVRTISFIGIIYAHTFLNSVNSKNEFSTLMFGKEPGALIALAAFFGVDTFLILSGFLQGFQLTNKLKKMGFSLKNYALLIRHRYVRIIPAYAVAMLIYWKIGVYFGNGPLWYQYVNRANQCTDTWWKNMLFMDNALNTGSHYYCMNWGWYLACDFQVFLFAPLVCWVYIKNKARGHNLIWFLLIVSICAGFIGIADTDFVYTIPPTPMTGNFWADFYGNTLVRMSSYLIGLLFGIQYRAYKNGETNNMFAYLAKNHKAAYLVSFGGFAMFMFEIFFPREIQTGTQWSTGFNYFWQVVDRPMLSGGIFLFIIPGILGIIKPISWFLGSYVFILGSKISFCGYLLQDVVILSFIRGQTSFLGFAFGNKNNLAIGFIMISMLAGAALHLLVEKPAGNMESAFLSIHQRAPAPPKQEEKKKASFSADSSSIQSYKAPSRFGASDSSPERREVPE